MKISFEFLGKTYFSDLNECIDISIPLISQSSGPKCFFAPSFKIEPVVDGNFIGSVVLGGPVNFNNLTINPHGNGTHTECIGHITAEKYTINQCLNKFHFISTLISVKPHKLENGDWVIDEKILLNTLSQKEATEAIIVRTLPNSNDKLTRDYSETNPPYFTESAIKALNSFGFTHLITDLPSIDKEQDGGLLNGHRAFWGLSESKLIHKTITEMVYIDNVVDDGIYLCNIQIAPIESDASPSKVILYEMFHKN